MSMCEELLLVCFSVTYIFYQKVSEKRLPTGHMSSSVVYAQQGEHALATQHVLRCRLKVFSSKANSKSHVSIYAFRPVCRMKAALLSLAQLPVVSTGLPSKHVVRFSVRDYK